MADLSGVLAKLERAEYHRQALDDLFETFIAAGPYTILTEFDPESGWHTVRWHVLQDPPLLQLALIFGDMISNLRTTLDYLVWQLVLASGKRPSRRTSFPVAHRPKDWEVQSRTSLRGVDQDWVDEIEAAQPYHWGERQSIHPLAILDHVNNLNKHRFLPAAALSVQQLGLLINVQEAPGEVIESRDFSDKPIVPGGELARFRVPSKAFLDVILNQTPQARLSFDDGLDHEWHPFELVEWVQQTIARFAPAFLPEEKIGG